MKGKLIIIKTKSGSFAGKIQFVNPAGKLADLPITIPNLFKDDSLNGKDCTFERDGGRLTNLVVDKAVLYPLNTAPPRLPEVKRPDYSANANDVDFGDSLDWSKTFLPDDTKQCLLGSKLNTIENFSLKFLKGARYDDAKEHFTFFKRERKGENFQIKGDFKSIRFDKIAANQLKAATEFCKPVSIYKLELQTDWRLALGLGVDNVYETGICLHHIYGFPYIPASGLKGVVRSWIITTFFSEKDSDGSTQIDYDLQKAEERALKNDKFVKIFGDNEKQGNVIFFDAFPTSAPTIDVDVMNPHYQPYYSESPANAKTAPSDFHNPVPVFFLTVKDTSFQFIIGSREGYLTDYKIGGKDGKDGKDINEWLKEALTTHGIGAKTAVGYGYMKEANE